MADGWRPLAAFRDAAVPKLDNLRRAARAGLRVPPTRWLPASELAPGRPFPPAPFPLPVIVRSGSPAEDTTATSNAGQLHSEAVRAADDFAPAVGRVVAALPGGAGAVFVQPLVAADEAGVAFFDGFYYERTASAGGNAALTAGQERGAVTRGTLERGDPWSAWLEAVYQVFGGDYPVLDVEWALDSVGYVLLQVRPALFPVSRNRTLSLANHKEIMGDPPSPWIVSVLEEAATDALSFFTPRAPAEWGEPYAVVLEERAWMNFSGLFRVMDAWGLPRSWVTQGVGGVMENPRDAAPMVGRLLRSVPALVALQLRSLRTLLDAPRGLGDLGAQIENARTLADLFDANVAGLRLALRTNFAIGGILSGVGRVRRLLRVPGAGRVVTRAMMEEYAALAVLPSVEREAALTSWLTRYGHRGPLESDPARPRFAEVADELAADLAAGGGQDAPPPPAPGVSPLFRPFFAVDERREWFRDELMHRWARLRARALEEGNRLAAAGRLDEPGDVFWLTGPEVRAGNVSREAVAAAKARHAAASHLSLPLTATRDEIEAAARASEAPSPGDARSVFPGIALSRAVFEGRAIIADDLMALLAAARADPALLGPDAVLVVPALEPSWAVVFPRVGGVVAEIGGELSHASILLREARKPAIVNCAGVLSHVRTGDRLRLDGRRGTVETVGRQ